MTQPEDSRQRGVQSVDTAARLLRILMQAETPQMLRDIAEQAGIQSAQAHTYMNSLKKAGLVQQFGPAGLYGLADQPLRLARSVLQGTPLIRASLEAARDLSRSLGQMVTVDLWIRGAATAALVLNGRSRINISLRDGSRSDLGNSASAWIFEAFRPADPALPRPAPAHLARCAAIRAAGVVHVADVPVPGLAALSAPVRDPEGTLVAAVSVIAPARHLPEDGPQRLALLERLERIAP
ncbi:IclR family transcriptional regulator [Pseudooceanicola albus]|nr:helix-turn-helix domain-containing protein [Pseudooceanicola albus]